MAQWGVPRTFGNGSAAIRAIAHVVTKTWEPPAVDSKIDDVLLLDLMGPEEAANKMLAELRRLYVGKPYQDWLNLRAVNPSPFENQKTPGAEAPGVPQQPRT